MKHNEKCFELWERWKRDRIGERKTELAFAVFSDACEVIACVVVPYGVRINIFSHNFHRSTKRASNAGLRVRFDEPNDTSLTFSTHSIHPNQCSAHNQTKTHTNTSNSIEYFRKTRSHTHLLAWRTFIGSSEQLRKIKKIILAESS